MVALRDLLAAVLGVGLGLVLLAAPGAVVRAQTAGRLPSDRSGEYGRDAEVPPRWRYVARAVGVGLIALGLYVGANAV
jgi:hypothetical protein